MYLSSPEQSAKFRQKVPHKGPSFTLESLHAGGQCYYQRLPSALKEQTVLSFGAQAPNCQLYTQDLTRVCSLNQVERFRV